MPKDSRSRENKAGMPLPTTCEMMRKHQFSWRVVGCAVPALLASISLAIAALELVYTKTMRMMLTILI